MKVDKSTTIAPIVRLPLSVLIEPEGFGERDFFAEVDNEYENEQVIEEGQNETP